MTEQAADLDATDGDLPASGVAPPVVAVVVTHDAGPWLEEALESLAAQDYPNLAVLVIDSASAEDPTSRIAAVLPAAYVRRLSENVGFGPAANEVLDVVEGASHFVFLHDDVALEPETVRLLVEEGYRSNAGVVAPKLVVWDDPVRLLAVGMTADKTGVATAFGRGELDQEQHDAVRDVFVAPGGCQLVRADLFATLGGFDHEMPMFGEDLDLSWRVQLA
ncbi:MAG TPA: glycosyltransferase family 2 protein, partial [Acidimicrobiales bacterium]